MLRLHIRADLSAVLRPAHGRNLAVTLTVVRAEVVGLAVDHVGWTALVPVVAEVGERRVERWQRIEGWLRDAIVPSPVLWSVLR